MRKFLKTGHPIEVTKIDKSAVLPNDMVTGLDGADEFNEFWKVELTGGRGNGWYVAKGHKQAPRQYVVWFPNGQMWSSYGKSIEDAMNLAIIDAFLYI